LLNRRAVGLSEAAQALETLNQVLFDVPDSPTETWTLLWIQHDMQETLHCLNTAASPSYPRTPERVRDKLKNYLKFHIAISLERRRYTEAFAANITRSVSLAWLLQGAALTGPGTWASKLASSVSREAPAELTALLAEPSSGSKLLNLLVSEVCAYGKVRSAAVPKSSTACGSQDIMNFPDDAEAHSAGAPPAQDLRTGRAGEEVRIKRCVFQEQYGALGRGFENQDRGLPQNLAAHPGPEHAGFQGLELPSPRPKVPNPRPKGSKLAFERGLCDFGPFDKIWGRSFARSRPTTSSRHVRASNAGFGDL